MTLERFNQGMGVPVLLGILFFFVLCLGASDSIRVTVLVVAVFTLIVIAARFQILRDRICWPFIALTLVVIMDGVSTFYAVSGKFALREFLKVFLAYLMAVILLATSPKKEEVKGKRIATILAVCTAIGSLVSIDLISTRWISGAVTWVLGHFTEGYEGLNGIAGNTRITSLFDNSNVFAGVSGIGALLAMGLAHTAAPRKDRNFYLVLLFINFLAFILSMSLGAIGFVVLAFVVFLVMEQRTNRLPLFFLMTETVVFTGISAAIISRTSFSAWTQVRVIPLCCVVVSSAAICLLDRFAVSKVHPRSVSKRQGWILIVACALIAAIMIVAWKWTEGITLSPGDVIRRTIYPEPGEYTLNIQSDMKPLRVVIWTQNQEDIFLYNDTYVCDTYLYDEKLSDGTNEISFTVSDDVRVVYFQFSARFGSHIDDVSCGKYKIPLRYVLLPEFMANRLQGLFANQNATRRLVYFQDGLKLFKRSPIVGLGIGAFENAIKSVQSIYYETKYAHNHYFQTMLETGIVGLLLFLFLLISSAIAIWKSRKEQMFAPVLAAVWFFMAGQAVHDIVFSAYAYLPVAYGSFILIDLCCGEHIRKPKLTRTAKTVAMGVLAVGCIVYCIFLAGNIMAKRNVDRNPTLEALKQSVKLDRFEWADYALPYVVNATGDNVNVYVRQQADVYAERLARVNSNTIPIYLAEYYFDSDRMEQGITMVEKYVDYVASDSNAWQKAFQLLQNYDDGSEAFHSGVVHIAEKLDAWNEENKGSIALDETATAYIESCRS